MPPGLLAKLRLNRDAKRQFRESFNQLSELYGSDFSLVVGQPGEEIPAVAGVRSQLIALRERALQCADDDNYVEANHALTILHNLVRGTRETLTGKTLELKDFGRSVPMTRERLQDQIASKRQSLRNRCPQLPVEMENDVAYVAAVLEDSREMIRLLSTLDQSLENTVDDNHALTNALRDKEALHRFPDVKALPVGILSGETFLGMTAWGWQAKDPGPGIGHGENTHRLQWFAIMQKFEEDVNNGQPWAFTPFELFTKIGDLDRNKQPNQSSIWGQMMDLGGGHTVERELVESPQNIGHLNRGFALPDQLNMSLVALSHVSTSPLAKLINDRKEKRERAAWGSDTKEASVRLQDIRLRLSQLQQEFSTLQSNGDCPAIVNLLSNQDNVPYMQNEARQAFLQLAAANNVVGVQSKGTSKLWDHEDSILYNRYMVEYGESKMTSGSYAQPLPGTDPGLLVRNGTTNVDMVLMTEEGKMQVVKQRQRASREHFGLPLSPEIQQLRDLTNDPGAFLLRLEQDDLRQQKWITQNQYTAIADAYNACDQLVQNSEAMTEAAVNELEQAIAPVISLQEELTNALLTPMKDRLPVN